jgi:hypothetical protein
VLTEALSITVTPPRLLPVTSGVNVAVTVHDLVALRFPPQGVAPLGVTAKYPLPVTLVILIAAALMFLMVTVLLLEVARPTFPKLRLAGVKVNGAEVPF